MRTPVLRALLCAAALFMFTIAHSANAATSAPGLNLRWDRCYADAGVWNKNFACDTNSGTETLVASFELADDYATVSGLEGNIDLASETTALPVWWEFRNVGTCRTTSLGMGFTLPPGSVACQDWSNGQAQGGIGAYMTSGFVGSLNNRRIKFAIAVPPGGLQDLLGGQEYFVARITINHAKTVGTGACGGCLTPVCIVFSGLIVDTPTTGLNTLLRLSRGANYAGSQYATWQNGYPLDILHDCDVFRAPSNCSGPITSFNCVLATPTNSRGSTWGAVKALYR